MGGVGLKAKKSIKAINHFEFNYFIWWWCFSITPTHTYTHAPQFHPHFNFENIFYVVIIIGGNIDGHLTKLLASKLISLLFTVFCLLLMVSVLMVVRNKREQFNNNNGNFAIVIGTSKCRRLMVICTQLLLCAVKIDAALYRETMMIEMRNIRSGDIKNYVCVA